MQGVPIKQKNEGTGICFFFPFFSVTFSLFFRCCCEVLCFLFHAYCPTARILQEENKYPNTSPQPLRLAFRPVKENGEGSAQVICLGVNAHFKAKALTALTSLTQ